MSQGLDTIVKISDFVMNAMVCHGKVLNRGRRGIPVHIEMEACEVGASQLLRAPISTPAGSHLQEALYLVHSLVFPVLGCY